MRDISPGQIDNFVGSCLIAYFTDVFRSSTDGLVPTRGPQIIFAVIIAQYQPCYTPKTANMTLRPLATVGFFLLFFFLVISASAQEWRINNVFHAFDSLTFASVEYDKDQMGIAALDIKGRVKWEIPLPKEVNFIGMGKWKNNLLVFFADLANRKESPRITAIHAMAIDLIHKTKLSDKICFKNPAKHDVDVKVLNDPDGNFNFLLTRITGYKNTRYLTSQYGSGEREEQTEQLSAVTVNDDGIIASADILSEAIGGRYFSSCTGGGKDLYIASFNNGKLTVEAFNQRLQLSDSLSMPLSLQKKWNYYPLIQCDPTTPRAIDLSLQYGDINKDYHNGLYRFDFAAKKILEAPDVPLTKDFFREKQSRQVSGSDYSSIKAVTNLKPVSIIETGDYIVLLKEIEYWYTSAGQNSTARFVHEGAVVEIYSKDLKRLHDCALGKYVETFISTDADASMHIKGDHLFVVSCEQGGIAAYADYAYVIDLSSFSVTRKALPRNGADRAMFMEAANVIWNNEGFIAPVSYVKIFFGTTLRTSLQKYSYEQLLKP